MKKKTTIRDLYWFTWFCYVFVMVLAIVIIAQMITRYAAFVDNAYDTIGIAFVACVIIVSSIALIGSTVGIVTLLKDIKSLKNNNYISIIGTVLNFEKNIEPESGAQINNVPTVLVLDTKEKITLKINDKVIVGETYKFNYLKNSKIAEIVEKNKKG